MTEKPQAVSIARDVVEPTILEKPTVVADADTPVADIIDFLAQTFYEKPDLPGVAVRDGDEIVGLITRQRLLALADEVNINRSKGLAGSALNRAHYFVCPKCDYEDLITFFDPDDPPICPIDKTPLIEEG
jgi:hypothetical protein